MTLGRVLLQVLRRGVFLRYSPTVGPLGGGCFSAPPQERRSLLATDQGRGSPVPGSAFISGFGSPIPRRARPLLRERILVRNNAEVPHLQENATP
jgi:hypothetical protein